MSDPSLEMQKAVVAALKAGVSAVADRVYDRVPQDAIFPYIEIGEFQTLDAGVECLASTELVMTLHAWSRAVGKVEAKHIAAAMRDSLHEADLTLTGFALVDMLHQDTRVLDDPDGMTSHAIVTVRALVDPA